MVTVESPFPEYAVPRVWRWIQEFRNRVADDYAPRDVAGFMADWRARQAQERTWAVFRDYELGGLVSFQQLSPVLGTSHCLFKKTFWGWQTTVPALELIYREIFEHSTTQKITAAVFRDNASIVGLARRLGAKTEGVLRSHTLRGGRLVDMVVLGLLKDDFMKVQEEKKDAVAGSSDDRGLGPIGDTEQPQQEEHKQVEPEPAVV